ncbi:MAG: sigma 54-interacting transcriptional regulator, partial [Thermoguttaceae bacterium]|nr:sigma 54-interacting transcriptional regulator [Thermoguttaceae bacterium]
MPHSEVDHAVEDAQRRVCQCLGLDWSALWQWSAESPEYLVLTHLYRSQEGPPTPEPMMAQECFPWWLQQLLAGRVIAVSSIEELPPQAARDREVWRRLGIQTTLTIPLSSGGGPLLGALSFHDIKRERVWPEPLVNRLQLVAQVFANALARIRSQQELHESEERLSLATAAAGVGVWMWDVSRDEVWATGPWRRMFGFSPETVIRYESVVGRVHPEDRETMERAVRRAIEGQGDYAAEYRVLLPDGTQRWIAARGRLCSGRKGNQVRMLGASVDVTDRKQVERALEERLQFENLLANLSAAFLSAPCDQIDSLIGAGLKLLVESLGMDRSSLGRFTEDKGPLLLTHSYTVADQKPFPTGGVVDDQLPWFVEQIWLGRTLVLRNLPDDLPVEATKEKQFCLAQGLKSNLTIPLKAGGTVLGAITFAFLRKPCELGDQIVARLQMIGEVFANVLLRKRSDEAIRAALDENRKLRERLQQENSYLREQVTLKYHHERIVGKSKALKKVLSEAELVAETDAPVLLLGETGTGKELLAETIHALSARKGRPMVVVNCASLPATLIESELFGRAAGAYTGAASAQIGRFDLADGSTLFLDEIGEIPIELQAKLLRVLQDGRFERLGSPNTVAVNVRLIAATNRNLEQAVRDGGFRADLYHRLSVFPIRIPPLRERREDIPALVWACIERLSQRMGKTVKSIPR